MEQVVHMSFARLSTLPRLRLFRSSGSTVDADGLSHQPAPHLSHGAGVGAALSDETVAAGPSRSTSFVMNHRASLLQKPKLYKHFCDKKDGCIKGVMRH
jgi:hypothetical protein